MTEVDMMGYGKLIDEAMRQVVRDVLEKVAREGLPGKHHCFISFYTDFPGVEIPKKLRDQYPEEMTIVLQHQFWDLEVRHHDFNVTLSFGGVKERLLVPFAALTAFADPSVRFGLQFQYLEEDEDQDGSPLPPEGGAPSGDGGKPGKKTKSAVKLGDGSNVVTLDTFRKK